MNFGLSQKCMNMITEAIGQFSEIQKAAIFGSRSMGNYKKGSDVDIVIFGENITDEILNRLSVQLNEILPLPYFFDIVHYDSLSHEGLKEHIDRCGKFILISKDNINQTP